jgi:hypothetical protein
MTALHGSSWLFYVAIVGFAFSGMLSALSFEEMNRLLGAAVEKALIDTPITVADAVAIMGIDESQFRKSLRGEGHRHLALNHLIKLGPLFMVHLTASLMWLTAKQRAAEIAETVSVRKNA